MQMISERDTSLAEATEFLRREFSTTQPRPVRHRNGVLVAAGAVAAGWFTYEPISELLNLKPGHADEVAGLSIGLATAALLGARELIRYACEPDGSYKKKLAIATELGAGGGLGTGLAIFAAVDAVVLGGLTMASLAAITAVVTGTGALLARGIAKSQAKKSCRNRHEGDCCERMCMKCGSLFAPDERWKEVIDSDRARGVTGNRLSWVDIASILHFRGLSYVEALHVYEKNYKFWNVRAVPKDAVPTASREAFFDWFAANEKELWDYKGERPSPQFWKAAERAVRSECHPNKELILVPPTSSCKVDTN